MFLGRVMSVSANKFSHLLTIVRHLTCIAMALLTPVSLTGHSKNSIENEKKYLFYKDT